MFLKLCLVSISERMMCTRQHAVYNNSVLSALADRLIKLIPLQVLFCGLTGICCSLCTKQMIHCLILRMILRTSRCTHTCNMCFRCGNVCFSACAALFVLRNFAAQPLSCPRSDNIESALGMVLTPEKARTFDRKTSKRGRSLAFCSYKRQLSPGYRHVCQDVYEEFLLQICHLPHIPLLEIDCHQLELYQLQTWQCLSS